MNGWVDLRRWSDQLVPQARVVVMPETAVRVLLVGEARSGYLAVARSLAAIRTRPHHLRWCNRFTQALPRMLSGEFDAILLDASGDPDTAHLLLGMADDQRCATPIILISDAIDADFDESALPRGAADALSRNGALDAHLLGRALRYAIDRRRSEQALTRQSQQDALTELPNRLLLRDRLQHALDRARRLHTPLALLHVNIDGFRRINEGFGHAVGDALLCTAARRLEACVRKTDTVARLGGDEFAIVLEDARALSGVMAVVNKVMAIVEQPFMLADRDEQAVLPVTLSLGIALYPEAGLDVDALIRHADQAMQQAKRCEGSAYHFFSEALQLQADEQLHLEADLRRALRRNEFELFYQPRVELESGDIVGVEALIRWRHPERGLLAPADFVPLAEEVGLIVPMGYWVIQRACRDMQLLRSQGHTELDLAINLSCRQFQDDKFVETVTRLLQQSGLDLTRIEFELTETAIMLNTEQMHVSMQTLAQLGVSFSLDDFGTGYSSFAHIQRLPISALKIDRGFVQRLPAHDDDATIVRAMINLARGLELRIIAEGAESLDQVQFLWENQCHQVQGYYFSPAVSLEHLLDMLAQRAVANF